MRYKIISFLVVLISFAQANGDVANDEALKARIQKDELYHHAKAQGLQILGPDPESDESADLELANDHSEFDQGRVDMKRKRDAQFKMNDYQGGDESANNDYVRRFRQPEKDDEKSGMIKMQMLKSAYFKLLFRMRDVESRLLRLEKILRNRVISPYYGMGFKKSPAVDK